MRAPGWLGRVIAQRRYSYPHRNLLAVGLPKSGSTWVERMLCAVPGYVRWTPPGSRRDFSQDLRRRDFIPPPAGYTVTKTHTAPKPANLAIIRETGRPYIVIERDLRDVAVSWAHFVALPGRERVTHSEARGLALPERIDYYIERVLPVRARWVRSWRERVDPEQGLMIRYEAMLADAFGVMRRVFDHYEVGLKDEDVRAIIEAHSFERATGRAQGEGDPTSFNRKGIAGDWRNHFTDAQAEAFQERVNAEGLRP